MKRRVVGAAVTVPAVLAMAAIGVASDGGMPGSGGTSTDFIQGRVTSADAQPEAGVWVIAQTNSLGTPYRKIVVTDDNGQFVIPQLPKATYDVWVRGYGLKDSK